MGPDAATNIEDFRYTLPLQQDIGLTIEDFILNCRLGLVEDASVIIREALWQHLLFFPVFAEIVWFLILEDKVHDLCGFLTLFNQEATFGSYSPLQLQFVHCFDPLLVLDEVTDERTRLADLPISRRIVITEDLAQLSGDSPIQVQSAVIRLRILATMDDFDRLWLQTHHITWVLCQNLYFWEAATAFGISCTAAANKNVDSIGKVFRTIYSDYHHIRELLSIPDIEDIGYSDLERFMASLLCSLLVDIAMLPILAIAHQHSISLPESGLELSTIVTTAKTKFFMLLQLMPDTKPRGKYWRIIRNHQSPFTSPSSVDDMASVSPYRSLELAYRTVGTDMTSHSNSMADRVPRLSVQLRPQAATKTEDPSAATEEKLSAVSQSTKKVVVIGSCARDHTLYAGGQVRPYGTTFIAQRHSELGGHALSSSDSGEHDITVNLVAAAASESERHAFCNVLERSKVDTSQIEILSESSSVQDDVEQDYTYQTIEVGGIRGQKLVYYGASSLWSPDRFDSIDKIRRGPHTNLVIVTTELRPQVVRTIIDTCYIEGLDVLLVASHGAPITSDIYPKIQHFICNYHDAVRMLGYANDKPREIAQIDLCDMFIERGVRNVVIRTDTNEIYFKTDTMDTTLVMSTRGYDTETYTPNAIAVFTGPYAAAYMRQKLEWDISAAVERGLKALAMNRVTPSKDQTTNLAWSDEIDKVKLDFQIKKFGEHFRETVFSYPAKRSLLERS